MRKVHILVAIVCLLVLVSCSAEPEKVEVTREVEVVREVEVTRVVETAGGGATLQKVLDRGNLMCGVDGTTPGFSFEESDGIYTGFDWEYCRVVAAAVLGDADAVLPLGTSGTSRFSMLESGLVDMLSRTTTRTTTRDTAMGFNFAPTTFYDGQGMMVRKDSGITDLEGLENGSVCSHAGATSEQNLADAMSNLGINYEAIVSGSSAAVYQGGGCDGYTNDKAVLTSMRALMSDPDAHTILDLTLSKEPLGPLVRHGDDNWLDVVSWSIFCTMQAEEKGVTSQNVDEMLGRDDPEIRSLLGVENNLGSAMGLNDDFCYQIIKQVGNYEEIYMKHLGPDTPLNLPRGINSLWTDGGLLYSPPFR